jgi:hypothetical protein
MDSVRDNKKRDRRELVSAYHWLICSYEVLDSKHLRSFLRIVLDLYLELENEDMGEKIKLEAIILKLTRALEKSEKARDVE